MRYYCLRADKSQVDAAVQEYLKSKQGYQRRHGSRGGLSGVESEDDEIGSVCAH